MPPEQQPQHGAAQPLEGSAFDLLILDFTTSALAGAVEAFGNLNSALIFAATARACGPFDQTAARRRPVSINALAASLDRPFETVRRHATALIDQGILTRSPGGLSVTMQTIADPRIAGLIDHVHDLLVRLIEDCRASGFALPGPRSDTAYDPRSGIAIALDLMLAAVECHGRREAQLTRLALLLAIDWADHSRRARIDDLTSEPAIRTSVAARILGLPYATASRNIEGLVKEGLLRRTDAGLAPVADDDIAEACRVAIANRTRQLIGRLAQAGFPMQHPATAYIRGRVPPPNRP
ncbi:ArsR family transcriptional regulator [Sphingomonas sp. ST-64]|uniref:ArsR family transcriptional regulator n=1 Tax=Sphingomonas plantiphila TaxID=3163295 RepID=A0ABW8YQY0_9SPHN